MKSGRPATRITPYPCDSQHWQLVFHNWDAASTCLHGVHCTSVQCTTLGAVGAVYTEHCVQLLCMNWMTMQNIEDYGTLRSVCRGNCFPEIMRLLRIRDEKQVEGLNVCVGCGRNSRACLSASHTSQSFPTNAMSCQYLFCKTCFSVQFSIWSVSKSQKYIAFNKIIQNIKQ